ncbi:SRPBCC family protein [Actinopolymorpha pittospori]|uniref:Uncharacterized protein YndB with AHSA1/START domain n=1 Tax=Actinopolymorpha pittospori TaxID=648752 RepID=A0A927N4L9_9ACTN|nr:SRPBCC domain-containing protein [Actinopolymorpha pittospori]MBE1612266.1 uncharacterized protein YndB with AHSA1/START domain [Actinopolymorpha pittospori]
MTETSPANELVISRVFDAPRELVYRAFVDPDQLAEWFGPEGFSIPRESVDIEARVGGHQRFEMVSDADPTFRSPVNARFTEVVENELLVGVEENSGMNLRVELHDEGGRTRLVLRQGPYSEEFIGMARDGWDSSLGKLEKLLGV